MISIIIPCFNVEKYLERCFVSCIAQTYQDFELIFVNDASKDRTLDKLKEFECRDKRVKVIDLKNNVGTFHARKTGYEASAGDYIFFLDPDDEIAPDFLELMFNQSIEKSADMIFCKLDIRPSKVYRTEIQVPKESEGDEVFENCIFNLNVIPKGNPGKFYKKSVVENAFNRLKFIDNRFVYAEDVVFFFAALLSAYKIASINKKIYIYYLNNSSITRSRDIDKIKYNIEQLVMAIKSLKNISKEGSAIVKKSSEVLINSLNYDKKSMERSIFAYSRNNSEYFLKTIEMLSIKICWRNLVKLFIFLISFSKVKMV